MKKLYVVYNEEEKKCLNLYESVKKAKEDIDLRRRFLANQLGITYKTAQKYTKMLKIKEVEAFYK